MNTKGIKIKERSYEIVNGPNKDTLFDACKYAYSKTTKFAIDFGVVSIPFSSGNSFLLIFLA